MEIVWLLLSIVCGVLAVGCMVSTAVEVAGGKIKFPFGASFWGAAVFHLATGLLALFLLGLWLGY